ncbi:MAG: methyltransferase domain-containing protein [Gammaproteobacteria bacterium]
MAIKNSKRFHDTQKRIEGSNHQHPSDVNLPYFDYILACLENGNDAVEKSFGRHVHWGYWRRPEQASLTDADFAEAAENLTHELCLAGQIRDGLKILDVGCGFGGTVAHINERFTGMYLAGLNLDERQLRRARAIVQPMAGNRVAFLQGNACELPFPDQSFDVVSAVECIFHFPSRERFFLEARRVLKPGGYLALSDFIPEAVISPFTKIKLPERFSTGFYGKCNVLYTACDYRKLAKQTHFEIRAERDITVNTLPTYRYLRRLARRNSLYNIAAMIETATIDLLSRLRLMRYFIYSFQKP